MALMATFEDGSHTNVDRKNGAGYADQGAAQ
jgi:hypothetical protein